MKPIEFDNTSIHYKLAVIGGLSKFAQYTDICAYTRNVVTGIFYLIVLTLAFTFISWITVHTVLGIGFSLYHWTYMFTEPGKIGLITFSIVLIWLAVWAAFVYSKNIFGKSRSSFVAESFQSWKGKYCAPVSIKGIKRDYDY